MAENHVVALATVRRIRKVSAQPIEQTPPPKGSYRGFGSVRETVDQFHDRMDSLDPLEAMMYEMDFELSRH